MNIWFKKDLAIEEIRHLGKSTMGEYIGIEWTELGENFLKATMPVDHRTIQPYGLLHGGRFIDRPVFYHVNERIPKRFSRVLRQLRTLRMVGSQ